MGTQLIIDANILYTSILPRAKVAKYFVHGLKATFTVYRKFKKIQDAPFVTQI